MSTVLRFANVAKRSGVAEVYAVASRELDAPELGCLLLHLRRVDEDWRPDIHERRRLAYALLDANVPDREIRDQLEISQKTLARRRRELADNSKCPRKPALQSSAKRTKTPGRYYGSSGPILHVDASSGNGDFGAMARLLGASV
jgi:Trp operon repressor